MTSLATAFDSRNNSIGFLRWLLAFLVIFSHAGPIAGFYGGADLGTQLSSEQSLGGVAVCGFFFLSGFLITRSKMGRASTARFFWHRFLRIFPGFIVVLVVTAFVIAPLAYLAANGSWEGYWNASSESPFTYLPNNATLLLRQLNIADMGTSTPLFLNHGIQDWNGSAWTLAFEFGAYILVGLLGVFGALANRLVGGIVAGVILAFSAAQWLHITDLPALSPVFGDFRLLLLLAPFAWGMLFQLFADKVPIDDRIALACLAIAAVTYARGGWLVVGQFAFCYFLIWFAIRVVGLRNWDRHGDFSYGIYISAWPIMWAATFFGLQNAGWLAYHVVVVVLCHVYGFLSWHGVEKRALALKSWTPRWLDRLYVRTQPWRDRTRQVLDSRAVLTRRDTPKV